MDIWHLILLALIQGITEFLPVSSSAHLILPAQILGWKDQGPLIDLMAHLGTLFAVMLYFRSDVAAMVRGGFGLIRLGSAQQTDIRLARNILIASPPVLILGFIMSAIGLDEAIRSPLIIAIMFIVFGIILWLADVYGKSEKVTEDMDWKAATLLGLSQMIALIPGTSRSGITMTMARGLGFTRPEAARFSMLMAIPVILAGGTYAFLKLAMDGQASASLTDGLIMVGLSFAAAYLAIAVFMKLIARISFFPFMVYRVLFGLGLLVWIWQSGGA